MNRIKNFIILSLFFVFSSLASYSQNDCIVALLANDLSSSNPEFKTIVNKPNGFEAWKILQSESPSIRTDINELTLVSKNLEAIKSAKGYLNWKALQQAGKVSLLTKFKDFTNIKSWINGLDDVADASLLSKLDNLEASYFSKLDADLVHATYGPEIKVLLKESPDDLVDVWKKLKDDPAFSWEIQKTGGSRWEKWSQREFFKDITAKGKGFETNVCLATFKNRSSAKYLELKQKFQTDFSKNLDDYDMYSQVQLKYDGDNYFVAHQLFVKYKTNAAGKKVVDDLVVIENKLSSTTPLITPQTTAFTKTSFTVRSVSIESATTPGKFLNSGQSLNFSGTKQWYKVHDGANGDVISGISKMN